MNKKTIGFVCQSCTYVSLKWMGKCPDCNQWNSFEEEALTNRKKILSEIDSCDTKRPLKISEIKDVNSVKIKTGINEFDRVMGDGLTLGSFTLIGGEPGIGKSTLLSMVLGSLCSLLPDVTILYVSGEESSEQILNRLKRMDIKNENFYIYHETSWQSIKHQIVSMKPHFLVIDSIQTTRSDEIDSCAGTVSQIREVSNELMELVKNRGITTFVIGHITKDGNIAGPKVLEHIVDTVIYFQGDEQENVRLIRSVKNRFGMTNEVGLFEMKNSGLIEINNMESSYFEDQSRDSYGRVITSTLEGSRPLVIEIQSLVVENKNGNGKRTTQGFDGNRLSMLIAVIEKYFSLSLNFSDIYLNIGGGLKLMTRESDLGAIAAILSSIYKKPISTSSVFLGEVSLTGEIRSVKQFERRVKELSQLGYKKILTSKKAAEKYKGKTQMELTGISHASELLTLFSLT